MASCLQWLHYMLVQFCYGVEEIVGEEEDHEGVLETTPPQFLSGNACFALAITQAIGGV